MFDGPWETCMLVRGLNPAECASWVQAWGAILAIASSAAVVLLTQRAEANRAFDLKRRDEIRLLQIVGQFVFDARAKLRDIEDHLLPHMHRNWTSIESPVACIRATPFDRYPSEAAAFAVATALVSYDFLRAASDKLEGTVGTLEQAAHIDRSRLHALAGFYRAEQAIDDALLARNSRLPLMEITFEGGGSIRTLEPDPIYPEQP